MNNTEKMVSVPREWLSAYLEDDAAMVVVDGELTSLWELLTTAATQPAKQHQGEPVTWSPVKPIAPGAYWIRGNGLSRPALIEVVHEYGELRCNLHDRTTCDDFGFGYSIEQLSEEFEFSGPLHGPTHLGEVQRDEREEFEAHYAAEFNKARSPEFPFTADDVKDLRDGDSYGSRGYLNGQWIGWQARAALERRS